MKAQVFLGYAREDEEKVESLYQKLSDAGFQPWMDKKDILPGEQWESCIRQAIRRCDFFLACLSANSVNKRGWIQREIKHALDMWQEKLEDDIYLIPVRLEHCSVPESLRKFQWVNLFEEDGWTWLVKAIQVGMERRAKVSADEVSSLLQRWQRPEKWHRYWWLDRETLGIEELDRMIDRARRNWVETAKLFGVSVSELQLALENLLADRHRVVLELRYGLKRDGKKRTYEEAAEELGVNARRIKELEEEGLLKLRLALNFAATKESLAAPAKPREVGESPNEADLNNVAIEILKKIAEENKGTVESLSSIFNIPEQKIQFYLDTLRARDFLSRPFLSSQGAKYSISENGRKFLSEKDLL